MKLRKYNKEANKDFNGLNELIRDVRNRLDELKKKYPKAIDELIRIDRFLAETVPPNQQCLVIYKALKVWG